MRSAVQLRLWAPMKKIYLPIIIFVLILIGGGIYYFLKDLDQAFPQTENSSIIENNIIREEIFNDLPQKISNVSPANPVLGGNWYITRFWFIQEANKNFYVEYEDGHIMCRILVEAEKRDGELNYKVLAYFEPGENDWVLRQGEDKFFGSLLDLYEYSEELNQWIKKN